MIQFSKALFILFISSIIVFSSSAQKKAGKNCATDQYLKQQIIKDPSIVQRMDAIEMHIQNFINNPANPSAKNAIITIPVVFHVVYNNPIENISDLQLQSQLDVLNEDFAALNSDISSVPTAFQSVIGNSQIQFCLASKDPAGNPTTGIVRVSTTTTSFTTNNAIKFSAQGGSDAWPASDYLNFWIGDLSGSLLGYAQFPGGNASTDGIVCLYTSIGRPPHNSFGGAYNLGRTATHEVGHWLNLHHIWGNSTCGNDFVADTPTQQTSNGGCPTFPHVTCSNGPGGDMFMNYMDYVFDACMFMFSAGQATRMNAVFAAGGPRASLLNSDGCGIATPCQNPPTAGSVVALPNSTCPGGTVNFMLSGNTSGGGQSYQWQSSPDNGAWTNIAGATDSTYTASVSAANPYFRCTVTCEGTTVPSSSAYVTVVSSQGGLISGPAIIEVGPVGGIYTLSNTTGTGIQWQFSLFPSGPFFNYPNGNQIQLNVNSTSLGTYYLRAETSVATGCPTAYSDTVSLSFDVRTGDNLNKPIVVGSTSYSYTDSTVITSGFTNQNGSQTNGQASADVYFKVTTNSCTDRLDINTCSSLFDTYVHLLDSAGNVLTGNDDNGPFCTGTNMPGSISFPVQNNTTYFVVVEGKDLSTGVFTMDINARADNPLVFTTSKQNVSCTGVEDGSVALSVSGGVAPYAVSWNTSPVQTSSAINNLGPGFYTATVTDFSGCLQFIDIEIREPDLLTAFYIPTNPIGGNANGQVNQLVTGGVNPYTYLWSTGVTTEDLMNVGAGTYFSTVIDRNGCAVLNTVILTSAPFILNPQPLNFTKNALDKKKRITIIPNPSNGTVQVTFYLPKAGKYSIQVFDLRGKKLMEKESSSPLKGMVYSDLDLSPFQDGAYLVKVTGDFTTHTSKLIKQ